ncbi:hypothetical protein Pmani_012935 [Petrolisthes manimaculis]|uniref:Uncharacterized protein n=1 Tax=Petrolisthes manimaculis TaxID=1843537 RepID=A0AAE1PY66_9EUCA|nr:hypothetical protein Pmani_012935 [Petrolisthes manimaculis]
METDGELKNCGEKGKEEERRDGEVMREGRDGGGELEEHRGIDDPAGTPPPLHPLTPPPLHPLAPPPTHSTSPPPTRSTSPLPTHTPPIPPTHTLPPLTHIPPLILRHHHHQHHLQ